MIDLEDHKIWNDELNDFVIRWDTVSRYLEEVDASKKLDEALRLIKESSSEITNIIKDLKV